MSLSGTTACGAITGGVVDATGTLDPTSDGGSGGVPTGYYAVRDDGAANPGQMADYAPDELAAMRYAAVAPGVRGWYFSVVERPDAEHVCGETFYDDDDAAARDAAAGDPPWR